VKQRRLPDASLSGDDACRASGADRSDEGIQQLAGWLTPHEKVIPGMADKTSGHRLSHPPITPQHGGLFQHVPPNADAPGLRAD
jgi:hypothetical protein